MVQIHMGHICEGNPSLTQPAMSIRETVGKMLSGIVVREIFVLVSVH